MPSSAGFVICDGALIGGLTATQILGLSVLGAIVTTAGSLIATWLRDFWFVRSFEQWKERRALFAVHRKYRDHLLLAANELESRVAEICRTYPPEYLRSSVLAAKPKQLEANLASDPYFQRYRLISTVFRLCAFLGWLELYRQELTFLDVGQEDVGRRLDEALEEVRGDLADGQLNTASDWVAWTDRLIFREEQRAIGESMIVGDSTRTVMGYAAFISLFERADDEDKLWWLRSARGFFLDPKREKDFRSQRLARMDGHLELAIGLLRKLPGTASQDGRSRFRRPAALRRRDARNRPNPA
jgi:hypothetical protein